jgi:hypothetical protein
LLKFPFQYLPNTDEQCSYTWGFGEALRFLVYTLTAVSILLVTIGIIRSCIIKHRQRRIQNMDGGEADIPEGEEDG